MSRPDRPKIYHITHVKNLHSIIHDGRLFSDAIMLERNGPPQSIGMQEIKEARMQRPVPCYPGDYLGDYVPFNFCPRSVMLHKIHLRGSDLTYQDGQAPIIHLEADLYKVVAWAKRTQRRWAFTSSHALPSHADFFSSLNYLDEVDWDAISASYWPEVKDQKQAEFLMHEFFPWELILRIGVRLPKIAEYVKNNLYEALHQPKVEIKKEWYYLKRGGA